MKVDARPFRTLLTSEGSCRCRPPKLVPMSLGVSQGPQGVIRDGATHTVKVFGPLPADLTDGAYVEVEGERYMVLRNGVDTTPYGAVLYVIRTGPAEQEPA